MGAKRAKRRYEQQRSNIINFQPHKHKQVQILPRNKNQETYMLKPVSYTHLTLPTKA